MTTSETEQVRDTFERLYAEFTCKQVGLGESMCDTEQARLKDTRDGQRYGSVHATGAWDGFVLGLIHASVVRKQAQQELESLKAQVARIGLDVDAALRGQVNESSPIASRLKLLASHLKKS